jgi:putative SOS response-associated peptidase YedK
MCYWVGTKNVREALLKKKNEKPDDEIAQLFYRTFVKNPGNMEFKEHFVAIGKAKPELSVVVDNTCEKQFRNMQWGLDWSYTDKKTGKTHSRELLNSTAERVFFQHRDIIYRNRCIIPIDGYFEYFHHQGETYPFFIFPAKNELFYAGGIWDRKLNETTGEVSETFSIITTPPNELAGKIHNNPKAPNGSRMLLILPEEKAGSYLDATLDTQEVKNLLKPLPSEDMKAHPVIRFQRKENLEYLNTDKVREPIVYSELKNQNLSF